MTLPSCLHSAPGVAPITARQNISIYIGEVVAFAEPTLIDTVLGSCVAVCLHDAVARVGGMNHILLPGSDDSKASHFGQHAMEQLIRALMKRGAARRRLEAKAFGAGHLIAGTSSPTVGDLNAVFVREFLGRAGIPLLASRFGGTCAVKVEFTTDTGQATVHTVDGSRLPLVLTTEKGFPPSNTADKDSSEERSLC